MESPQPIVELRVTQKCRWEGEALTFTSYTLQYRTTHDPVWKDVPVTMEVDGNG